MLLLHAWETFYVIVGSSAAALTGLQFVVIALGADRRTLRDPKAVEAFGTPTIVHFCAVLTIAALIAMPGHTAATLTAALILLGVAGLIYCIITARRAGRQTGYTPVLEDWLWHAGFPIAAYTALVITGIAAYRHIVGALYFVAVCSLALLFIGIHNAWDSAVYISMHGAEQD
jgi:hypothetical protein